MPANMRRAIASGLGDAVRSPTGRSGCSNAGLSGVFHLMACYVVHNGSTS
jgi:hypothetical protein